MAKKDIDNTEQNNFQIQQLNRGIEEQAQLQFQTSLSQIKQTNGTELLEQKFWELQQHIKMVCKKNTNGLIVDGSAGLGKSHNILKVLNGSGIDFIYCSGFATTLELYNFLYENRRKIIFFDDTKNIFKSESSLELLKAALFSPTNTRIVRYLSTTSKLKAPSQFIFEGGIIIALNDIGKFSEDLNAVVDRVSYIQVKFSYKEKLQILQDLIKQDYKDISAEERQIIFDWINTNTTEATINLNFRLLFKLYEIYIYDKANFDKIAKGIIRNDEQQELIISLLKKHSIVKLAQEEWCEVTGMSRVSFYREKKRILTR